jgi:hypothetical protein
MCDAEHLVEPPRLDAGRDLRHRAVVGVNARSLGGPRRGVTVAVRASLRLSCDAGCHQVQQLVGVWPLLDVCLQRSVMHFAENGKLVMTVRHIGL